MILFISFSTELFPNTNSITIPAGSYFKPKIGLALSGGGARGIAQIGVLKSFEKNNINIDYISGTSIGAIVGGLYASGYTGDELEKLLSTNDWSKTVALSNNKRSDLFLDQKEIYDMSLITVKFDNFNIRVPEAVSGGSPFDDFIQRIFWSAPYQPESNFDSLKIPFRAVATDLVSASSISFAAGNITKIVRASATIPLRYTPIRIDSMVLVDGGVLSNVPVPALNEFKPDLIIAVNSTSPLLEMKDLNNAWNLADQVVSIAMDKFTQSSMSNSDLVITPNIGNHSNNDFSNLDSLIILGEQSSDLQVINLKQLIRQKQNEIIKIYIDSIINQLDFNAVKINFENYPPQKAEFVKNRFGQTLEKSELEAFLRFLIENNNDNEVITLVQEYDNLLIYNQESKKINSIKITSDIDDKSFIKNLEYSVNFKYKSEYYNKFVNSRIINSIYQELKNQNYQFCKVSVKSFNENELNIEVKSGKINKINIKGSNVRKFMVLRDLVFEENDLLTVNSLIDSWENLQNTDLFVDVEILPYRDKDNNLNIDINLRDGGDQTLRIGGRVDSERNAQGGLYLIQENLFNLGTRLLMHLTGSETYFTSSVRFDNPRIFNTEYSVLIDAYYKQKQNYEYTPIKGLSTNRYENSRVLNYRVERYGIIGSLGIQIEKDGRLFSDFRFEKQRYNKDSDTIKSDFYDISTIKLGTIFDNLNDKYFPTNGRSIELFLETNFLQSSNIRAFSKAELNYLSVFSIGKHTISQSLQFGAADETLPYPEFFSMGGEDKFLGMLEDEMIGRQIVLGTLAYRVLMPFELFFDTYFLFNYNIGSAWEKTENIRIGDLKHGLGLGLAFNTPLGPAKVLTGKGFYFRNAPQGVVWGPTNFYFSLGMKLN